MKVQRWGTVCALVLALAGTAIPMATADDMGTPISIGVSHQIASSALGESREVMVALPEGYETSGEAYPVIYLLEGQWYFGFGADMVKRMASKEQIPPSILVALKMANPKRFGLLQPGGEGAGRLLAFIENELMPFVDGKYRTNGNRTLIGWEYGGAFTLDVLAKRPDLFDGYIASSPYPVSAENSDFPHIAADSPKALFFGVSDNETVVNDGVKLLETTLKAKPVDGLTWDSYLVEGGELIASHITSPYPVFMAGLSHLHKEYRPLKPATAAEFRELGGLDYARAYYRKRAGIYGTPADLAPSTLWWLGRIAMEGDDVALMEEIVRSTDLFSSDWLALFNNAYWYAGVGRFLTDQGKPEVAIPVLAGALENFPASVQAAYRLAVAYQTAGRREDAIAAYEKAIALAEAQSHDRTEFMRQQYQEFLAANEGEQ